MDTATANHLAKWLETVHSLERDAVREGILRLIADDPDLVNTHSWPELRRLAQV